jgi:pseudomonalisin
MLPAIVRQESFGCRLLLINPRENSMMIKRALVTAAALFLSLFPLANSAFARGPLVINENDRIRLPRSVHPLARPEFDRGASSPSLPMERMILALSIPPERQVKLDQLLVEQHDPSSSQYHRWLTPEEFGQQFGPAPEDIAAVVGWLTSNGFSVQERAKGGTWINFSGTAADVKRAFRTEIHDYQVHGKLRHANASAPEIPRGLSGLVSGVVTLHNFPRKSMLRKSPLSLPGELLPAYSSGSGNHTLAPGDFATIYNVSPLYNAGLDGSGQTIAIVGRTHPSSSNWATFRSSFGLSVNDPQVVLNGSDPGDIGADEDGEADLDVEWSGAVAKNATVKFVVSKSTLSTDGVDLSAQYVVENNLAPVMSTSFGSCESDMGTSENAFYNNLWQQAASQGITSFVSTGDAGAAGCDDPSAASGSALAVNGLASTPYNVAVGGTQFNEGSGSYWNSSNLSDGSSVLSYIPETAWNESASQVGGAGLWSTGGGASSIYPKPSWQALSGVPADGKRDIPDVSLNAATYDGYRVRSQGSWSVYGGTSASSPSLAGIMALVVQKTGQRQGNANIRFYQLASAQYGLGGAAAFHDITAGSNSVPGLTGNFCAPAYDMATGLGSVDANVLVSNWDGAAPADFYLSAARAWVAPAPGGATGTTLSTTLSGGFSADITLVATGLPNGVTASCSPATLPAPGSGSSLLTFTTSAAAPSGSFPITLTGSGAGVTHGTPVTLISRNPNDALLSDGFESGSFSSWTAEAGSYVRTISSSNPATGSFSYTQTGGDTVTPRNGLSHTLPSITPSYIAFYAKTSSTSGASAYFVIGDDNVNTNRGIIFFAFNGANLAVYDGTNWKSGAASVANTWYFIEFKNINWVAKTYDFYVNGQLQAAGVAFRSQTTTALTKLHLYNMDPAQAWYDDIFIGTPNIPPAVTVTVPAGGATGTAVATAPSATFSRGMDASTISAVTFTVKDSANHAVAGSVGYDPVSNTATFTPAARLSYSSSYSATVGIGAKALTGTSMAAPFNWSFTTSAPVISVVSTAPVSGASGVDVSGAIKAVFSAAMDATTLNASSFTLAKGLSLVPASVVYDQSSKTATLTPLAPLDYGASYTASIGTGAQDLAGNPLWPARSWLFTTALPRLSVAITGSGSVNSSPQGIACASGNSGVCSAQFGSGTTLTLMPAASGGYLFDRWSGGCSRFSDGNCLVDLATDQAVRASFVVSPLVRIAGGGGYPSLQAAYDAAGAICTIQAQGGELPNDFLLGGGKTVYLEGGFNSDYTGSQGDTALKGVLTLRAGTLRVKSVVIR